MEAEDPAEDKTAKNYKTELPDKQEHKQKKNGVREDNGVDFQEGRQR